MHNTNAYPTMISPAQALTLVLAQTADPTIESIPLADALNRTLASSLKADRDYPPFNRAMMDGFAVRINDAGKTVAVPYEIAAGDKSDITLKDGDACRIMTGAPCPVGTDLVVPIEQFKAPYDTIKLPDELMLNKHIANKGSECEAGTKVVLAGTNITPLVIANLATFGITTLQVFKRPTVAVIPTGSELVDAAHTPAAGQIRDSNGPTLSALVQQLGLVQPTAISAADNMKALTSTLKNAVTQHDIILLSGGVSAGKYDLVPDAIEAIGGKIIFHKVAQRPGKPILFATYKNTLIFGLPGNPLSGTLGFHKLVTPAIKKLLGKRTAATVMHGTLLSNISNKGPRKRYVLSHAQFTDNGITITPLPGKGSADIHATASANCYIEIPEGNITLKANTTIKLEWLGNIL